MERSVMISNLQRVVYSVFVIALIAGAAYILKSPTRVEAQKFENAWSTRTEQLATSTFPYTGPPAVVDEMNPGSFPIVVSGLTDQVRGVALNVDWTIGMGTEHTWVGDLAMTLTNPPCGTAPCNVSHTIFDFQTIGNAESSDMGGPYTFGDGATLNFFAEAQACTSPCTAVPPATYRTSNSTGANTLMNPAFQGSALMGKGNTFEKLEKSAPIDVPANLGNGTWTVSITDNGGGDSGIMGTGGLSLTITTLAPTAALAEIRGGVRTAKGRPISGAYVTILNTNTNQTMTVRTGTFGNFRFEGLPVGSFYTMWVEHGRYQFGQPLQSFTLESDIGDATFISN